MKTKMLLEGLMKGCAIGATLLCLAEPARAAGLGGYFEYSYAASRIEYDDSDIELDFDSNRFGIGFLFDTNVAKDRLFNYRLEAGYQYSDTEIESDIDASGSGIAIGNSFGFGFVRTKDLRVWAGPHLKLTVDFLEDDFDSSFTNIGFGVGPQIGLNWHVSPSLSLTGSLAYDYRLAFSSWEDDYSGLDDDGFGGEHVIGVNIGMLFRTPSDRFDTK